MDPDKSVVFAYDGVTAHLDLAYASPLDITEKVLSCLEATSMADILSPEIERCACITGMRENPSNPSSGGRTQHLQCLKLCVET